MGDIYNVDKYTNAELIEILDLFNPTDRELEAKIIYYVKRYSEMTNEYGKMMLKFFHDIHSHFFDIEEYENENENENELNVENDKYHNDEMDVENIVEGFHDPEKSNPTDKPPVDSMVNLTTEPIVKSVAEPSPTAVIPIRTIGYMKGTVNPILKDTITRTMVIDSQFRDVSVFPTRLILRLIYRRCCAMWYL